MPDLNAGTKVRGADTPPQASSFDSTNQLDLTNTTPDEGSPEVGTQFTSPTTGRVKITIGMGADTDATGISVRLELEVYEGIDATGTLVHGPAAVNRLQVGETNVAYFIDRTVPVTGLTPNVTHFARVVQSVSGGSTADILHRSIMVEPAT